MKWWSFVWRSATRNRRRSILIVLSLAVTFFLFTTLRTTLTAFDADNHLNDAKHRVFTQHAFSLLNPLPQAGRQALEARPEAASVCGVAYYAGFYRDDSPENLFFQYAADTDTVFQVWDELTDVPEDQKQAFLDDRQGCLVHQSLLDRFEDDGWALGHEVPLMGGLFPVDLRVRIRGVTQDKLFEDVMVFHWKYFDEANSRRGQYSFLMSRCDSAEEMAPLIAAVDQHFESSSSPTKSMTEAAFNESFQQMLGPVRSFVRNLCIVMVIVMVLAAGNSIALAARERVREIATLRALGFSPGQVRGLILKESCVIALLGGALGCGLAWVTWSFFGAPGGAFVEFHVTLGTLALGVGAALLVGMLAGWLPAVRASRRPILDGLRKVC